MSDVTVVKKGNGKREVRWRDQTGRRRGRSIERKRDADRFATELRRQQVGDLVDLERGMLSLAEFVVDYWRATRSRTSRRELGTSTGGSGTGTCVPASAACPCVSSLPPR
jgi:hypothetical protein